MSGAYVVGGHEQIRPRASLTERARREAVRLVGEDGLDVATVTAQLGVVRSVQRKFAGVALGVCGFPGALLTDGGAALHEVSPVAVALTRMPVGPGPTGTVHAELPGDCIEVSRTAAEGAALLHGEVDFEQPTDVSAHRVPTDAEL